MDDDKKTEAGATGAGVGAEAGASTGSQGFSAVSEEARRFLQSEEKPAEATEERPRQKFILSKKTLAKQKVEFGPTEEGRKALKLDRKMVGILAGAGAALVVLIVIIVMVVINAGGDEVSTTEGDATEDEAPVVVEREYPEAAYVIDGTEMTFGEGTYEATADGQVVFLVINGGRLVISGKAVISGSGVGSAAIMVIGEGSSARINGATITASGADADALVALEGGKIEMSRSVITAESGRLAKIEGASMVNLNNCDGVAVGKSSVGDGVTDAAVLIYQASARTQKVGIFTATDSSFKIKYASEEYFETPFFFVTNTVAQVNLRSVKVNMAESAKFITAKTTEIWGEEGENGAEVVVTAVNLNSTSNATSMDGHSTIDWNGKGSS